MHSCIYSRDKCVKHIGIPAEMCVSLRGPAIDFQWKSS